MPPTLARLAAYACGLVTVGMLFFLPPKIELLPGAPSRVLAVFPFFVGLLLYIENPPPGAGVGKAAGSLGKRLSCVSPSGAEATSEQAKHCAPPPLSADGTPLQGHAYLIVFFSTSRAVLKAAAKTDAIARRITAAGARGRIHPLLVSRDPLPALEAVSKHWKDRVTPIAHDASQEASANYITAHKAWAQPHAFVVGTQGTVVWHGQINRKELTTHIGDLLRAGQPASTGNKAGSSKKES
jgi:hypothetical protein